MVCTVRDGRVMLGTPYYTQPTAVPSLNYNPFSPPRLNRQYRLGPWYRVQNECTTETPRTDY